MTSDLQPSSSERIAPRDGVPPSPAPRHLVVVSIDDPPPMRPFRELVDYDGTTNPDRGNLFARTPVIDALAANGVLFTGARNACVCSPGRASLLTGVYPFRHGVGTIVRKDRDGALKEFLDPGFVFPTLPQVLGAGVHKGIVGKVHLSADTADEFSKHPGVFGTGWEILDRIGFDFMHTTLRNVGQTPVPGSPFGSDGSYYRYYYNHTSDNSERFSLYPEPDPYNTTLLVDSAIEFMTTIPAGKRAFLYLAFNAAHGPFGALANPTRDFPPLDLVATQEYIDQRHDLTAWPVYMAMMEALDKELGRFLDALPPGIRQSTTVVVLADNGIENTAFRDGRNAYGKDFGPRWDFVFDAPESRLKGSVYHWGTWMQLIWNGPGVNDPGRVSQAAVDIVDLPVTIARYFGKSFPPSDGIDFLDVAWHGKSRLEHARQQNYSEQFYPMGDRFGAPLERDDRSLWRWLLDEEFAVKGRFSLVRRLAGPGPPARDELYRLQDENGATVDLWEETPLAIQGEFQPQYAAMCAAMDALLDSNVANA